MNHRMSSTSNGVIEPATCSRCHGLMVHGFTDYVSPKTAGDTDASALRCVNCGDWIDATIAENRRSGRQSDASSAAPSSPFSRRPWR
ncbi:MAG: hypothetical protein ABI604_10355 [Nitrospirota bacterium]